MRKTGEGSQVTCPGHTLGNVWNQDSVQVVLIPEPEVLIDIPLYTCCAPRDHGHCEACSLRASSVWTQDMTSRKQTRKRTLVSQRLTELQEAPGSLRLGSQHKLSSLNSSGGGACRRGSGLCTWLSHPPQPASLWSTCAGTAGTL